MAETLSFSYEINSSLQVGDMLYFTAPASSGVVGKPLPAGRVTEVKHPQLKVEYNIEFGTQPTIGDYVLFAKPTTVNESSLKGYYADVTLTNSSTKRAELFAVSSGIALSSK